MTMRTIHLHGEAGEFFGKTFEMDVSSLAEAVKAIGSQIRHFRQYIAENEFKVIWGKSQKSGKRLGKEQISDKLGRGDIHIVPVIRGAKRGGLGKIIAGVLIAAVAWWAAPVAGGLGASIMGGVTYGNVAMLGIGLAATGLSQLLAKNEKTTPESSDESFTISGQVNTTEQGGPVALIYGRCRVGSTLISSGMTASDTPIGA